MYPSTTVIALAILSIYSTSKIWYFDETSLDCSFGWWFLTEGLHQQDRLYIVIQNNTFFDNMTSNNNGLVYSYSWIEIKSTSVINPDNKVHGANMGPTWVLSIPDWVCSKCTQFMDTQWCYLNSKLIETEVQITVMISQIYSNISEWKIVCVWGRHVNMSPWTSAR